MHEPQKENEKAKKLREEMEAEQRRALREALGDENAETFDQLDVDPDRGQEHAAPLFLVRHNIRHHEDYIRHMYRDTKGVVTVGIGFAMPNEGDATAFTWRNRFSRKTVPSGVARAECRRMKALPIGKIAEFYKRYTALELLDSEINSAFNKKLFRLQQDLRREFRIAGIEFDHLPVPVQEAMYDMGWNMGAAFINKVDLEKAKRMRWKNAPMWPKLTTELFLRDWEGVAAQSERGDAGELRNHEIKGLIRKALERAGKVIPEFPEGSRWD